ncbi:MAG TPA: class I SAM-dependent methyltransferase [Gemmatimonadaceae bacterium]|nr:class I SAM-dependent methyltransferase [Gemmatimonadaceae bacterium]
MTAADRIGVGRRREVLARGARGLTIEIGAGTGLEFPYYPAESHVIAVEPDVAMIARARTRRSQAVATISLVIADARALPFRDGVFDSAVSALAFCTIPQPARAAAEIRRVLKETGGARLLEHVRAAHRPLAWLQVAMTPVWRRLAAGCHLDRRTTELIRAAGFDVTIERASMDGAVVELIARPSNALRTAGQSKKAQPLLSVDSGSGGTL